LKPVIIIAIAFVLLVPVSIFAQEYSDNIPTGGLQVLTDASKYYEGDTIIIYGKVLEIVGNNPVIIQVFNGGTLIDIIQVTVARDNSFTHTLLAEGATWEEGDHVVKASYSDKVAETKFSFFQRDKPTKTNEVYSLDVRGHGTFDVSYSIFGAKVKDMALTQSSFALLVSIDAPDEGYITIELPNSLIAAKKQSGYDDTFIVLIDGIEVPYNEKVPYNESDLDFVSRVITINFEQGDNIIKIMGTSVLGESTTVVEEPTQEPETKVCTAQYDPVCGVDGRTYGNQCTLNSNGIELDYSGECLKSEPKTQIDPPSLQLDAEEIVDEIQDTNEIPDKIPDWVKHIFVWYGQGIIDEGTLIEVIQYLIDEGIVDAKK